MSLYTVYENENDALMTSGGSDFSDENMAQSTKSLNPTLLFSTVAAFIGTVSVVVVGGVYYYTNSNVANQNLPVIKVNPANSSAPPVSAGAEPASTATAPVMATTGLGEDLKVNLKSNVKDLKKIAGTTEFNSKNADKENAVNKANTIQKNDTKKKATKDKDSATKDEKVTKKRTFGDAVKAVASNKYVQTGVAVGGTILGATAIKNALTNGDDNNGKGDGFFAGLFGTAGQTGTDTPSSPAPPAGGSVSTGSSWSPFSKALGVAGTVLLGGDVIYEGSSKDRTGLFKGAYRKGKEIYDNRVAARAAPVVNGDAVDVAAGGDAAAADEAAPADGRYLAGVRDYAAATRRSAVGAVSGTASQAYGAVTSAVSSRIPDRLRHPFAPRSTEAVEPAPGTAEPAPGTAPEPTESRFAGARRLSTRAINGALSAGISAYNSTHGAATGLYSSCSSRLNSDGALGCPRRTVNRAADAVTGTEIYRRVRNFRSSTDGNDASQPEAATSGDTGAAASGGLMATAVNMDEDLGAISPRSPVAAPRLAETLPPQDIGSDQTQANGETTRQRVMRVGSDAVTAVSGCARRTAGTTGAFLTETVPAGASRLFGRSDAASGPQPSQPEASEPAQRQQNADASTVDATVAAARAVAETAAATDTNGESSRQRVWRATSSAASSAAGSAYTFVTETVPGKTKTFLTETAPGAVAAASCLGRRSDAAEELSQTHSESQSQLPAAGSPELTTAQLGSQSQQNAVTAPATPAAAATVTPAGSNVVVAAGALPAAVGSTASPSNTGETKPLPSDVPQVQVAPLAPSASSSELSTAQPSQQVASPSDAASNAALIATGSALEATDVHDASNAKPAAEVPASSSEAGSNAAAAAAEAEQQEQGETDKPEASPKASAPEPTGAAQADAGAEGDEQADQTHVNAGATSALPASVSAELPTDNCLSSKAAPVLPAAASTVATTEESKETPAVVEGTQNVERSDAAEPVGIAAGSGEAPPSVQKPEEANTLEAQGNTGKEELQPTADTAAPVQPTVVGTVPAAAASAEVDGAGAEEASREAAEEAKQTTGAPEEKKEDAAEGSGAAGSGEVVPTVTPPQETAAADTNVVQNQADAQAEALNTGVEGGETVASVDAPAPVQSADAAESSAANGSSDVATAVAGTAGPTHRVRGKQDPAKVQKATPKPKTAEPVVPDANQTDAPESASSQQQPQESTGEAAAEPSTPAAASSAAEPAANAQEAPAPAAVGTPETVDNEKEGGM